MYNNKLPNPSILSKLQIRLFSCLWELQDDSNSTFIKLWVRKLALAIRPNL